MQCAEECSEAERDHHGADSSIGTGDQVRERVAAVLVVFAGFRGRQGRRIHVGGRDEVERDRPCVGILGRIRVIGEPRGERLVGDISGHRRAVAHSDHFAPTDAAAEVRVIEAQRARDVGRFDGRDPVAHDADGGQPAVAVLAQRGRGEAVEWERAAVQEQLHLGRQRRAVRLGVGFDGLAVGLRRRLGETQDVIEFDLVGGDADRGVAIDGERPELVGEGR
jgi:hypothetical protein